MITCAPAKAGVQMREGFEHEVSQSRDRLVALPFIVLDPVLMPPASS